MGCINECFSHFMYFDDIKKRGEIDANDDKRC